MSEGADRLSLEGLQGDYIVGSQVIAAATNRQRLTSLRIGCQTVELGNNVPLVIIEHQKVVSERERTNVEGVLSLRYR